MWEETGGRWGKPSNPTQRTAEVRIEHWSLEPSQQLYQCLSFQYSHICTTFQRLQNTLTIPIRHGRYNISMCIFIGFRSHQRFLQVEKLRPNVLFHFMPCPPSVDVTCRSKTRGTNDNVNMERVLKITLRTFLPTAGYLIRVCTGHNLRSSGTRHLLGHVEASRFLRDFPDFGEGQEMC